MAFCLFNTSVFAGSADDGCGPWLMPELDSGNGGEYASLIQLRSCELTRGISAFLQFQNNSKKSIKLTYRILTSDKFPKEGEIDLTVGKAVRAGTCQACTARKGGIQSWQIISVLVIEPEGSGEDVDLNGEEPMDEVLQKIETLPPAAANPATVPVTVPAETEKPVAVEPKVTVVKKIPQEVSTEEKNGSAVEPESNPDGLVTPDGKVIPWDQVPAEFRPRDKR